MVNSPPSTVLINFALKYCFLYSISHLLKVNELVTN